MSSSTKTGVCSWLLTQGLESSSKLSPRTGRRHPSQCIVAENLTGNNGARHHEREDLNLRLTEGAFPGEGTPTHLGVVSDSCERLNTFKNNRRACNAVFWLPLVAVLEHG